MAKGAVDPLEAAIASLEKDYGPGTVMMMGEAGLKVESVSTGILPLDLAIGVGGLPRGRIIEAYGPESSGKSTIAMHCVAEAQRLGEQCVYVDAEHAMDPVYAGDIGVQIDKLLISQPDTGEHGLEVVDRLARTGAVSLIVVDSVAALTPRAEIEGEMGDAHVGLHARMMAQGLRKLSGIISKTGTTLLFINQLREKIGVMYGSPEVTPGGRALKFYASVRLDVRRIETLKDPGGDATANRTRVKVVKNKVSPPFKQAEFDIVYGQGAPRERCLLDIAVEQGIVNKSGAWFNYQGEQIGQGRVNAAATIGANSVLYLDIMEELNQKLGALNATDA